MYNVWYMFFLKLPSSYLSILWNWKLADLSHCQRKFDFFGRLSLLHPSSLGSACFFFCCDVWHNGETPLHNCCWCWCNHAVVGLSSHFSFYITTAIVRHVDIDLHNFIGLSLAPKFWEMWLLPQPNFWRSEVTFGRSENLTELYCWVISRNT